MDDIQGSLRLLNFANLVLVHLDALVAVGELLGHAGLVLFAAHDGLPLFGLFRWLVFDIIVDDVLDLHYFNLEFLVF